MLLPGLITALALLLYMAVTGMVGAARGKYHVRAPATTGHPEFEKRFRVQQNTMEQLVLFLPALWLFTFATNRPHVAAAIGAVWLTGRIIYAITYYGGPERRYLGFVLGFLSSGALLLGSLWHIVVSLIG